MNPDVQLKFLKAKLKEDVEIVPDSSNYIAVDYAKGGDTTGLGEYKTDENGKLHCVAMFHGEAAEKRLKEIQKAEEDYTVLPRKIVRMM